MSFLKCIPSVFVIGNEYEILVTTQTNGISFVRVGEENYYEDTSGVLSSEKNVTKIRVPQKVLNAEKKYEIVFRETINRKAYFSLFKEAQTETFAFKPLEKTDDIHIYHIADVHYRFETALKTADYFGENVDLFVVNGDIGEVETEENYFEVCKFTGEISKGSIPTIFVRGNHDTRGKLAEKFTDYFPCNGKKTYFDFEIGCLKGVVLDCGEDKWDNHKEYGYVEGEDVYGGANIFQPYRKKESEFLKNLQFSDNEKYRLAITHICPVMITEDPEDCFNIEKERYREWSEELERLKIRFMLCGHIHKTYVLPPVDERNTQKHSYPVVFGSSLERGVVGAAITLNGNEMEVLFTDQDHTVRERHIVKI